jgi:hypothetical protein
MARGPSTISTPAGVVPATDGLVLDIPRGDTVHHVALWKVPQENIARALHSIGDEPLERGQPLAGVDQACRVTGPSNWTREVRLPWSALGGRKKIYGAVSASRFAHPIESRLQRRSVVRHPVADRSRPDPLHPGLHIEPVRALLPFQLGEFRIIRFGRGHLSQPPKVAYAWSRPSFWKSPKLASTQISSNNQQPSQPITSPKPTFTENLLLNLTGIAGGRRFSTWLVVSIDSACALRTAWAAAALLK